jgi:hypothetical protein
MTGWATSREGTLGDRYLSVRDSAGNTKLAESDNGSTGLARSSIAVLVRKVYLLHGYALFNEMFNCD